MQKWRFWLDIKEKITIENKHKEQFHKIAVESLSLEILETQETKALYLEQPDQVWTLALLKQVFRLPTFFPT